MVAEKIRIKKIVGAGVTSRMYKAKSRLHVCAIDFIYACLSLSLCFRHCNWDQHILLQPEAEEPRPTYIRVRFFLQTYIVVMCLHVANIFASSARITPFPCESGTARQTPPLGLFPRTCWSYTDETTLFWVIPNSKNSCKIHCPKKLIRLRIEAK